MAFLTLRAEDFYKPRMDYDYVIFQSTLTQELVKQ